MPIWVFLELCYYRSLKNVMMDIDDLLSKHFYVIKTTFLITHYWLDVINSCWKYFDTVRCVEENIMKEQKRMIFSQHRMSYSAVFFFILLKKILSDQTSVTGLSYQLCFLQLNYILHHTQKKSPGDFGFSGRLLLIKPLSLLFCLQDDIAQKINRYVIKRRAFRQMFFKNQSELLLLQ